MGRCPKQHSALCSEGRTTKALPSLFHSDLDPLACYPSVLYFRLDPSQAHPPSSIRACLSHVCQESSLDEVQSYQPLPNSWRPLLNTKYTRDKPLRWHLSSCANIKCVPLLGPCSKFMSKHRAPIHVEWHSLLGPTARHRERLYFPKRSTANLSPTACRRRRRWSRKVVYHHTAHSEPFRRRVRPND